MADANATAEAGVDRVNQEWNPDNDDFISDTVFAGIVLFTVGVAVLLAFFIYYAVRCVCWTCLGDECCDKRNKVRASQSMVKWNNYAVSVLLLACIAGGAWLLYAGTPIVNSLDSLTNTMVLEAEAVKDAANITITTVEAAVGNDASVDLDQLKEAEDLLTSAQADLELAERNTRDATDSFGGLIIFIGVCAIVCAILGLLCVFVRNIIFLYLYFIVATFTVFALWSLAGFAFVGHRAFDETCKMMELHYQGNPNDYVTDNLPCDDLAKAGDAVTEAQEGANAAVEAGNEQLERLNQDLRPVAQGELKEVPLLCQPYVRQGGMLVPNNATANGCVKLTAENIEAEYSGLVCPNPQVTEVNQADGAWLQCAVFADPSTPMPNSTYTDLVTRAGQLEILNSELDTIRLITGCGFVDVAFEHITDTECKGLKNNSNRLATAALISAITLTITSFYFCICIQNIRKQDAPQPAPGEEEDFVQAKSP